MPKLPLGPSQIDVSLFATPRTIAHQAPLSMGFSRQKYWSGLPIPSPRDLNPPPEDTPCFSSLSSCEFFTTVPSGFQPHLYPTDSTSQAALSVRTRGSALRVGSDGAWSIRGPSMENVDPRQKASDTRVSRRPPAFLRLVVSDSLRPHGQ